ncbi:MAG TPA: serine hydrolase domain-containing protein [Pirellulales bacterium]|jgi:CubicO group peptidase (beta-lactamase class C family)|nr:serine hydrolase domain-containing protein [Pirellulales bacterium]
MRICLSTFAVIVSLVACQLLQAAEPSSAAGRALVKFVDDHVIAGAVTLVAQDGKIVSLDAVGRADLAGDRPMRPDTLFWIASMTKPITTASVMILQDEGKLSVLDPVKKYLPEFKSVALAGGATPSRPITLRDLLTHTSGIANPPPEVQQKTLTEVAEAVARQPLQFEPGSQWKYGFGLSVAGRVVEVVSGQTFDAFVDDRICRPLGMNDTTFYPSAEQRQRLATIYAVDKESKQLEPAKPPFFINAEPAVRHAPNPSGGLVSTAGDYYRFLQMVLNGGELDGKRIVSAEAAKQMTSIQTGDIKSGFVAGSAWGLGWGIVREPQGPTAMLSPGSYGHGGAFGTQAWVDPKRHAIFIMLIQRAGMPNSDGSEMRIAFQTAAVTELKN